MKKVALIAIDVADALHTLPTHDQKYILSFSAKFLKPFPTLRRMFGSDIATGKTGDGYPAYVHIVGDLYILYSDFVHEGERVFLIFNVLKKQLKSIKLDPGDPSEKIISKISH